MSKDWAHDMRKMHDHYGITKVVEKMDAEKLTQFVNFRAECVQEEVDELKQAIVDSDAEEMVDALIDVCVFAIGTLDLMDVDASEAWDEVWLANMAKRKGIKKGRPNPYGLPDLTKPHGWTAPDHLGNHGRFIYII